MKTIHIMTASLAPGDAIGNYILTSARLWRQAGFPVQLYADHLHPAFRRAALPSSLYPNTGRDLLWYHYSIDAENAAIARRSRDLTVMDYHGITPPQLFAGYDARLQALCQRGREQLPGLTAVFNHVVVHSGFTRLEMQALGVAADRLHTLPLCVDTRRLNLAAPDPALDEPLSRLDYLLFVGRIVPQKDILALLALFARLRAARPSLALILAGSRQVAPAYQQEIDRAVQALGLTAHVLFAGQVNQPQTLAALLRHGRFLIVTSEWETFCVPLVEAMAAGLPSIVHDVPPLPEIAADAAIVVDKRDPDAAAARVLAVLADPPRYQALAAAARARLAQFTDAALARALSALQPRLMAAPRAEAARS